MNNNNLKSWAQSSMDPTQVSNTIRGFGTALSGIILLGLALTAHPATADQLSVVIDQVAVLGGQIAGGVGAAWALYGLIMKGVMFFATHKEG